MKFLLNKDFWVFVTSEVWQSPKWSGTNHYRKVQLNVLKN